MDGVRTGVGSVIDEFLTQGLDALDYGWWRGAGIGFGSSRLWLESLPSSCPPRC